MQHSINLYIAHFLRRHWHLADVILVTTTQEPDSQLGQFKQFGFTSFFYVQQDHCNVAQQLHYPRP